MRQTSHCRPAQMLSKACPQVMHSFIHGSSQKEKFCSARTVGVGVAPTCEHVARSGGRYQHDTVFIRYQPIAGAHPNTLYLNGEIRLTFTTFGCRHGMQAQCAKCHIGLAQLGHITHATVDERYRPNRYSPLQQPDCRPRAHGARTHHHRQSRHSLVCPARCLPRRANRVRL